MKSRVLSVLLALALMLALPTGSRCAAIPGMPAIRSVIYGFQVVDGYREESTGDSYALLRHEKSGAQMILILNGDTNRAFGISFRTPAKDDKGIPHIFEHATLSGSEKFPDPNLFSSMISQTYNTYLNAQTNVYCTTYPSASLSEEQLYAFVRYTLAGVSRPLIMTDEHAMMREAYRYELADRDADITLSGTVYSEMLGSLGLTSRHKFNVAKTMSPGSCMANISGGDPDVIPTLTHQELKDFHDDYYHPSNALMVLYGNVNYRRFLKMIDEEYLSGYEARDIEIADEGYAQWEGYREAVFTCPVTEGDTSSPAMTYSLSLDGMTDEELFIGELLIQVLNQNDFLLFTLCRERLPGRFITASISREHTAEPVLQFELTNGRDGDQAVLKSIADEAVANVLTNGVDPETSRLLCESLRLSQPLMASKNSGVMTAISILNYWGRTGDVNRYQIARSIRNNIMDYSDGKALNAIFRKYLTAPARSAMVTTLPERGGQEAKNEELKRRLADMKAGMTDAELQALQARTADFVQWTKKNAETSLIDRVKVVDTRTLPVELVAYSAQAEETEGVSFVSSQVNADHMLHISLRFDASSVPAELLHAYGLRAELTGQTPTKTYTSARLNAEKASLITNLAVNADAVRYADGSFRPVLNVSWYCMDDGVEDSFAIVKDMLFNPDFSDVGQIREYAGMAAASNASVAGAMPSVTEAAVIRLMTREDGKYQNLVKDDIGNGFLIEVAAMSDEELTALRADMEAAWSYATGREGLIVTAVGCGEGIKAVKEQAAILARTLDPAHREPVDYTPYYRELTAPVAVVLSGAVQYNSQLLPGADAGYEMDGKLAAMQMLVGDKVLTPILRFQNSAYGASCMITEDVLCVSSFRDPGFAKTYEVFGKLGDMIRGLELTQDDLDGYITSAFSDYATPKSPLDGGMQAVNDAITGKDAFADTLRYMKEVKAFSLEDVEAYADLFDKLAKDGLMLTLATEQTVNENRDLFGTIIDMQK